MNPTSPKNPAELPQDPEIKTPERILKTPDGEEVEVRTYDVTGIKKVIGDTAIDTRDAVVKLYRGEGPAPIPNTKKVKQGSDEELEKKMLQKVEKVSQTMEKQLGPEFDTLVLGAFNSNEYIHNALHQILEKSFVVNLDQLGIALPHEDNRQQYDFRYQSTGHEMRKRFIKLSQTKGEEILNRLFQEKLRNYMNVSCNKIATNAGYPLGHWSIIGKVDKENNQFIYEFSLFGK